MDRGRFHFDWILADALAVGPAPRADRHLQRLADAGIRAVLSLCSIAEAPPPIEMEHNFSCRRLVLPDHRSAEPMTIGQLQQAISLLSELQSAGSVYVHCVAGVERSPMVCMAWLVVHHGQPPQRALDYVMQAHPGTNPLPRQWRLLDILRESSG
jgi:hypothetical protein